MTGKSVSGRQGHPTRQRLLKAKIVKSGHDRHYIKDPYCAQRKDLDHNQEDRNSNL